MRALTHGRTLTPSRAQDDESMEGQRGSPVFQGQRSRSDGKLTSVGVQEKHASKVSKRESLKAQKKNYRREKKRAAKELLHTLKDPSVVVMADWLKVRGSLKSWTKLWCSLKPGLLVLYKSHKEKSGHWVGTVLLSTCELIERPSKKDGFCFKLFHPLDQSIWAPKGPKGETIGAITQPLPYSYLIFRAPSESAGKCWMDALELSLRCSNLLMRTMTRDRDSVSEHPEVDAVEDESVQVAFTARDQMNESDVERHFKGVEIEDEGSRTDREEGIGDKSESDSDPSDEEEEPELFDEDLQPVETPYQENQNEELGQQGDACQTEEIADENKSLIWTLVKQVRPGMDLSKVVLPTFILEPRSLLDKFSDYYYHADYITEAILQEDPYTRIKSVVRWYLSGFYKKPKGLKKPYNPILGETFRCYWKHPKTNSRTFFIAEQISHHPPVTAFFVTNRKDGFCISGSVLAKSKFYGNSVSAIMDGIGRLSFLKRGEDYLISMPYAHCKGILIGTLTMELGGKVSIECEKTGYRADLEFKLKPFLGSGEASNRFVGKIKLGSETLSTLDGHWDQAVFLKDKKTGESTLFWDPTPEVKRNRLLRHTVPLDQQKDNESEKLWVHVSKAVLMGDQEIATKEKHILEEIQRKGARERKAKMEEWAPNLFERDPLTGDWVYKFADQRPWDPLNDLLEYENDYIIRTKTRHRTPIVRTTSITNVDDNTTISAKRKPSSHLMVRLRSSSVKVRKVGRITATESQSGSSTPDMDVGLHGSSDSSDSGDDAGISHQARTRLMRVALKEIIEPLEKLQNQSLDKMSGLQNQLYGIQQRLPPADAPLIQMRDLFFIGILLMVQSVMLWFFK